MDFDDFILAGAVDELPEAVPAVADVLEFRMDLAVDPLEQLDSYELDLPLIVTNRTVAEGGEADGPERLATLERAIGYPEVEAVDIELSSVERGDGSALLDAAATQAVAVIVSWHDFEGTPSIERLRRKLQTAGGYGAVAKAAVTATKPSDVLTVLRVTDELTRSGEIVATMCMGEIGRHSRIVAPLYGSRIGYAPLDSEKATAPGQYDIETMADLIERLE